MKCYPWGRSPERLRDFLEVLPQFGATDVNAWAEAYAEGQGVDRVAWDVEYLTTHYQFGTCLNIGAAPYIFEFFMRRWRPGLMLASIDLDVSRFPGVERTLGVRVHEIDVERPADGALDAIGRFQCVVFCEVLEHLRQDVLRTLSNLRELLTDDGILYLTTPNGMGIAGLRRYLFQGRTGPDPVFEWSKLAVLGHMGHVREYSFPEVRGMLEHCGFDIVDAFYRFGLRRPHSLQARMRNALQILLTRAFPSFGGELVIVARKRLNAAAAAPGSQ